MVPRVTANSLQMNQILKGSNSTHLTMQRKLDLGNIICSMCQQTSCALYCLTHYVACHCSVFLIFFSCIVAILLHLSSFFKCKMPIFHFFSGQYVHSPHLAVNFYLSWWSTSTPPGSHPSPLLAVNLHPAHLLKGIWTGEGRHEKGNGRRETEDGKQEPLD